MSDEKNKQFTEQLDIEQICCVIRKYVKFCLQSRKLKSTTNNKEKLSQSEIEKKEELETNKKEAQQSFNSMFTYIAYGGISTLKKYVDAMKRLYEEKNVCKSDIKNILVSQMSLKLFRDARSNLLELYPLLITLNKTFQVDNYSELSISPKVALYGIEVKETKNDCTQRPPLKNEDIQAMLDVFVQKKDNKRLGEWMLEILCFQPSQLVNTKFIPEREKLKEWAVDQSINNDRYNNALIDEMLKANKFKDFLDAYNAKPDLISKQAELEKEIKSLKEKNINNLTTIQKQEETIAELQQKLRDFESYKKQLNDYKDKYHTQIAMNERIVAENERRLKEKETKYGCMQDEFNEMSLRLETVEMEYSALQSDFSLKDNELERLKDIADKNKEKARADIMKELVSGINDQFFYLTMFYLELKETGRLELENIELYADTLEKIDNVLLDLGIKKIGFIDQTVAYDSTVHRSTNAKIANGEQVKVSGYGWKIDDEIYIKAPVEKGE